MLLFSFDFKCSYFPKSKWTSGAFSEIAANFRCILFHNFLIYSEKCHNRCLAENLDCAQTNQSIDQRPVPASIERQPPAFAAKPADEVKWPSFVCVLIIDYEYVLLNDRLQRWLCSFGRPSVQQGCDFSGASCHVASRAPFSLSKQKVTSGARVFLLYQIFPSSILACE